MRGAEEGTQRARVLHEQGKVAALVFVGRD
jgi:hypothetical protein